ncbi:ferrous iron transport protein B [Candidatus Desulforudis audaxviator]|uniref:Ferrous iron transport protein B n=1 Tax=Desulforudis audaxviator (strain MP104C) TaxID=477974 RepID=B1I4Y4_DESAP|nr:ferrous iron transport protein B [Candidatus Desulforudis audaxviator]ACA60052.1 small GTP-binding protein [Candidatus Desulforudis audaxviator MP104C]AZK60088.1 Ferrous iron transport protein B [Candidatus Desulforudis audaxviator]
MKHHHNLDLEIQIPRDVRKVVLAGNPNTGKSVFFNALTGLYVDVSNYPGTTLEISHSRLGDDVLIDTPGVYGISSFNDEERIARDIILAADVVINVVNAVHLERDLFLTQQIIDTGVPVVVALNMVDEAAAQGIETDVEMLSAMLGVPVIPTVAVKRQGFEEVKAAVSRAARGNLTPGLAERLLEMQNRVGEQGDALLILEGDPAVAERHGVEPGEDREEIYRLRRERVNALVAAVVRVPARKSRFGATLGHWMLRPLTGIPILLLTLFVMYQVIGVFIAQTVVGFTEDELMGGLYEPAVSGLVGRFISEESVLGVILIGEFGVLTMTVIYILGLLLPLIMGFYFFLALFEDSGYLPRIATLADRVLTGIGLNGKAVIPFILGFGCVTMATITTRMLNTDRERRIAIFLLGLTIPCSAQLAVIAGMLAGLGAAYLMMYMLVILTVFVVVGTVLNTVFAGTSTHLLIDLPPLRVPRLGNVLKKTVNKTFGFLKEATPLFVLGAVLISTLQLTGALTAVQRVLAPVTMGWLNLPMEAATAFIMGIVRRDFGAAGLLGMELNALQTVVALITITLFVPCIASVFIIFKERSWKDGALIWGSTWLIAFVVGGTVMQLGRAFTWDGTTNTALVVAAFAAIGGLIVGMCKLFNRAKRPAAAAGSVGADF